MIESYMIDNVVLVTEIKDEFGAISSTTETTIPCRLVTGTRSIRNVMGAMVSSTAQVWLPHDRAILLTNKFKIGGVIYPIISIEDKKDFQSRYKIVYL